MYGLDRFSVFVDRRPFINYHTSGIQSVKTINGSNASNNTIENTDKSKIINSGVSSSSVATAVGSPSSNKLKLNEYNLCNFVTRNNYAIFSNQIHLQCNKPLVGRYLYIQADGRSNRWSRLFSAVICEVQVYEL